MLSQSELAFVRKTLDVIRQARISRKELSASRDHGFAVIQELLNEVVGKGRVMVIPAEFSSAGRLLLVEESAPRLVNDGQEIEVWMKGLRLEPSGRRPLPDALPGSVNVCMARYRESNDSYELCNVSSFDFRPSEVMTLTQTLGAVRNAIRLLGELDAEMDNLVALHEKRLDIGLPFSPGAMVAVDMRIMRIVRSKYTIGIHTPEHYGIPDEVIEVSCSAMAVDVNKKGPAAAQEDCLEWPVATMSVTSGKIEDCDMVSLFEGAI